MKMMERFARSAVAALMLIWLACSSGAMANSHSGPGGGSSPSAVNDVLITNGLNPATFTPQVMLLLNYGGNAISLTDITAQPHSAIQLYNSSTRQPTNGSGAGSISYFYLPTNHTARFQNYSTSNPFWVSIWCPVDTSANGQNPTTGWFNNTCFGYPLTSGAPNTAVAAGATLVEPKLTGHSGDTIDISEVNGVTAQWKVQLPNGGWCAGAFRNGSFPPHYPQIQWPTVMNQPGSGAKYYGDYGNPGVYPFGCTNCVSR